MRRKPIKKALSTLRESHDEPRVQNSTSSTEQIAQNTVKDTNDTGRCKNKSMVYSTFGERFRCPYCKFHSKEKGVAAYHIKTTHKKQDLGMPPVKQKLMVGLAKNKVQEESNSSDTESSVNSDIYYKEDNINESNMNSITEDVNTTTTACKEVRFRL